MVASPCTHANVPTRQHASRRSRPYRDARPHRHRDLPDVRGLYRFYEELALRFAERGYPAVAFDYFGRTAGVAKRDNDFVYMDHVAQTTPDGIQADIAATAAYLRSPDGGAYGALVTVGFCFGGHHSCWPAAGGTTSPAPSASTACPVSAAAGPADPARSRHDGADPRLSRRRRRAHHGGRQRGVRRGLTPPPSSTTS